MSVDGVEYLDDPKTVSFQKKCVGLMSPPEILLPSGFIMATPYLKIRQSIHNLKVLPDDVWICGFPKSGTTWIKEMVWLLGNGIDFKTANSKRLPLRVPFFEYSAMCPDSMNPVNYVSAVENMGSPRFISTHLPTAELPTELFTVNPKIIYIRRNPMDVAVSFYHHFVALNNYSGTIEEFVELFLEDKQMYCPFWKHTLDYWELRDKDNVLVSSFEDMKSDLAKEMKRIAVFLGVSYTKEQEKQLLDYLSFKKFKQNRMVNFEDLIKQIGKDKDKHSFIRRGEVDSWKEELPPKYIGMFEKWTEKWLDGSDFPHYRK